MGEAVSTRLSKLELRLVTMTASSSLHLGPKSVNLFLFMASPGSPHYRLYITLTLWHCNYNYIIYSTVHCACIACVCTRWVLVVFLFCSASISFLDSGFYNYTGQNHSNKHTEGSVGWHNHENQKTLLHPASCVPVVAIIDTCWNTEHAY